jgi:pimeloyl-ACP methyl ester carboxylesterase
VDRTRSRRRRLLVLVPGALIVGLAIGVGLSVTQAGGWEAWLGRRGVVPGYGDEGRAVPALGGRRLYLDCRGSGSPTVVLEAGMGMDARSWGAVFPMLSGDGRTCVYSRANRWGSDPRDEHTVGEAVADLRGALAAAGEKPPFVLVGHSLGDVYARIFADAHAAETAGLVLVDPFGPDQFRRLIAQAPPELAARWQANLDGNIAAVTSTERLDWAASEAELAAVELGELPVETVVVPQPFATDPNIPDADRARLEAAWYAEMADVSGRARVTLAPGSGHMIQWDRPDLVVAAVRRVRAAADGD